VPAVAGESIRMNRLLEAETRTCQICALDHGMTSPHFLTGPEDTGARVPKVIEGVRMC
jgi:DhnA family fructose-bisphosphate aldolase class Ia